MERENVANILIQMVSQIYYRWVPPIADGCGEDVGGRACVVDRVVPHLRQHGIALRHSASELWDLYQAECAALAAVGGRWVAFEDDDYPASLRHIKDPPPALAMRGDARCLARPRVAIIGARKATPEALGQSRWLGHKLARMGVSVVSGGAIGCDIWAHAGALDALDDGRELNCRPVVVFAGGLAQLTPARNARVFRRIEARGGLILSERLARAWPQRHDFLVRNRIISGVSQLVVVVQASETSGAMATARHALEQGREVVVLAGEPNDVRFGGNAALTETGAVVLQPDQVADHFEQILVFAQADVGYHTSNIPTVMVPT